MSQYNEDEHIPDRGLESRDRQREVHRQRGEIKEKYDEEYDMRRRGMVEQEPGQYPLENQYEYDERYDENDFEQDFMSDQAGNRTS